MPIFPERQSSIQENPVEVDIPQALQESSGIKKIETAFTATVKDDQGNPMVSTPVTQNAKIQLPGDKLTFIEWSKGAANSAKTWLGIFWLRFIKRQDANTTN